MSVDLYYHPMSSPCRAVLLAAEAVGLPLNLKELDVSTGEHRGPEYEQLNPRKTIPLLVDGDYKLTESRAIMSYLVDQYGKNPRLNPRTPTARALVSAGLHFDCGTLYNAVARYYYPVAFFGREAYEPEKYDSLRSAFEVLDTFLDGQDYVAGRSLTIADLAIAATVSTAEALGFELEKYRHVSKWFDRVKSSAPGYRKANAEGVQMLKARAEQAKTK